MEIGDQSVYNLETIAGVDINISFSGTGNNSTGLLRRIFQSSGGCRSNRDYPSSRSFCPVDRFGGFMGNNKALRMNLVVLDMRGAYRLKGAQSRMQRKKCGFDTVSCQLGQNFVGKVKAGSWRRNSSRLPCDYRLIPFTVAFTIFT